MNINWNMLLVWGVGQKQLRKAQRRSKNKKSGSESQIPAKTLKHLACLVYKSDCGNGIML